MKYNWYYLTNLKSTFDRSNELQEEGYSVVLGYSVKTNFTGMDIIYVEGDYKKIMEPINPNIIDYFDNDEVLKDSCDGLIELTNDDEIVNEWNRIKHIKDAETVKMLLEIYLYEKRIDKVTRNGGDAE